MNRTELLARIKRLLTRTEGNGCTEAEAASALAKAREPMEQHNLDADEVLSFEEMAYVEEVIDEGKQSDKPSRMPFEYGQLAAILQAHFGVMVTSQTQTRPHWQHRLFVFGPPVAVETARWVYWFLIGVFEDLWLAHRAKHRAHGKNRRAYYEGLMYAVSISLRASMPKRTESHSTALVRTKTNLVKAFQQAHPDCKSNRPSSTPVNFGAIQAGILDGQKINIARPVAASGPKALPKPQG